MAITLDGTAGVTTPGLTNSGNETITGTLNVGGLTPNVYPIVSGTAVASTSGTSIDFTSIPSWVKRITVMFNGVSTNGSSIVQIQIGSGSYSTGSYKSTASFSASIANQFAYATTGFIVDSSYASASLTRSGIYVLTLIGSNTWIGAGNLGADASAQVTWSCAGNSPALSGALDRVRITTVNGTDTFDAGSINLLWE